MGKKVLLVKVKTKAQLKRNPKLKIKLVWKTSERELGRIKSINENYYK